VKLTARYLKPFWALVLICILLLFGQAMSELSLPNLMSSLVNTGIQQSGLETDAPEAMSKKAQTLLLFFCGDAEKELLTGNYYTIEPESSEAQRISTDYPLARKEAVCVLREGLDEETELAVGRAYAQASYGFLLYMQEASASGELEELAGRVMAGKLPSGVPQQNDGSGRPIPNIFDFPVFDPDMPVTGSGGMPSDGDGYVPSYTASDSDLYMPQGQGGTQTYPSSDSDLQMNPEDYPPLPASSSDLQILPRGGEKAQADPAAAPAVLDGEPVMGTMAETFADSEGGESAIEPSIEDSPLIPEKKPEYFDEEQSGNSFSLSDAGGLGNMTAERLYQILPLLELAPEASLEQAISTAAGSQEGMAEQVGVSLKKIFYTELGIDIGPIQTTYIWHKGLQMLGVALLGAVAAILVGLISSRLATAVAKRLRHDLFVKVMGMNGPEFDKVSIASLITRTTNDVQQVGMLIVMGLRLVCYAPIMGAGGILLAVEKSVSMSWLVAVAVLVMLGLVAIALALALPRFKALQGMMDKLNRISREHLSGMMVVRAFGNQKFEEERFREANREFTRTNRFVQRVMAGMMPAMMLVMNISTLAIMWVGGHAIAESALQIGDMMAFIQYAMQIIAAFLMIAVMFVMLPRASVSAARIREVLELPLEVEDPISALWPEKIEGILEFKDVSFRYSEAETDVLEHISFTARPGETTAIIGATGSGKSTLVNLIPRFYDVTEGQITLDGKDIRNYKQKDLRAAIGYVPQKALLFSGSIKDNLHYGKGDAEDGELEEALEAAQAKDFVDGMEKGMDSYMSQGGTTVSGGQRQRLSIARALVRKAPVYIFDDSFSALDFKTEAALRKALRKVTENAAVLVVAQRVSTIMHAEQILVLDEGRLVGKGTHKELLLSCPEYREIAESQLRKEELA